MKILVINASPRMESGNTQAILTPFLVGAKEAGATVEIVLAARKKINPCIGCFSCYAKTPGKCVHDDEMGQLSEKVRTADVLALATPVYIDGMPSLAKKVIDRLVTFMDPLFVIEPNRISHPLRWDFPKKMFLISVCGYPGLRNFDPLVLHFERISENFHSEFSGALLRPAIFSVLLTKKYPDRIKGVLKAVRSAGYQLVTNGKVSDDTLESAAMDICSTEELIRTANSYWDRELRQTSE
ncbi:MAG: flavodoxin family protein [Deltaproteobacteria bacterium]|nr:flavodoxin family protein [Deltaproteobacteria bacterium]